MDQKKEDFANLFAKFYYSFFSNSSKSVEILADIQKKFPKEYNCVKNFASDPQIMNKVIDKLPPEKQGILLKILFKAGNFSTKMVNLFESTEEQKRTLVKELNDFAEELSKTIKE